MTNTIVDGFPKAIPIINTLYFYATPVKTHPDILVEMPQSMTTFIKSLILFIKIRYPGCGFDISKLNVISFGIKELCESSFVMESLVYYDMESLKCFIAFNTNNIITNDLYYIAYCIKNIMGINVYLNMDWMKYPYFYRLDSQYTFNDITNGMNTDEIKKYQSHQFVDNLYNLTSIFLDYLQIENYLQVENYLRIVNYLMIVSGLFLFN